MSISNLGLPLYFYIPQSVPNSAIELSWQLSIKNNLAEASFEKSVRLSTNNKSSFEKYSEFSNVIKALLISIYEEYKSDPSETNPLFYLADSNLSARKEATQELFKNESINIYDLESSLIIAAMFKAIYYFLKSEDRYILMDSRLLLVFSLWQWFHILKRITACIYDHRDTDSIITPEQQLLRDEFSIAYRALNESLRDAEFVDAIKFINFWRTGNRLSPGFEEFIIYSLVLVDVERDENNWTNFLVNIPAEITGFSRHNKFDWKSVKLHPVFNTHKPAQTAIKRLVTHSALPSYDFDASFNLAHLLKSNRPLKLRNSVIVFILLLIAMIFMPVIIRNMMAPINLPILKINNWHNSLAAIFFFIALAASGYYLLDTFHRDTIIHLLLPRVWAGILVGYSTLLFESGSVEITCALWNSPDKFIDGIFVVPLWLILIFISVIYLYNDIRPWAVDKYETRQRTWQTLAITMLLSILIGFIVIPLSTYSYDDYCNQYLIKGIYGVVDFKQLSVFVPLAYLTGLISQFIFEEKPLTTSVWAPLKE